MCCKLLLCILMLGIGCQPSVVVSDSATLIPAIEYSSATVCKMGLDSFNERVNSLLTLPDKEFEAKSGVTKLEAYSALGDELAVKVLLRNQSASGKIYSEQDFERALFASSSAGSVKVITVLLKASNGKINSEVIKHNEKNSVVIASSCGHLVALETLLKFGFSPNETNDQGLDAMMLAIFDSNVGIAKLLVSHGYDSCKNKTGKGEYVKEVAIRNLSEIAPMLHDCGK